MNFTVISKISYFAIFVCLFGHSAIVMSEESQHNICFNFTIVTKQSIDVSEVAQFKQQKSLLHEQISRTQSVFDKNKTQNCPKFKFAQEIIKHVTWEKALRLSQPLDQAFNEKQSDYQDRKIKEHLNEIESIATKIKQTTDIKDYSLLDLSPGIAIVNAERALVTMDAEQQRLVDSTSLHELGILRVKTQASIQLVNEKLEYYGVEKSVRRQNLLDKELYKLRDSSVHRVS